MRRIVHAWTVLRDPVRRQAYDAVFVPGKYTVNGSATSRDHDATSWNALLAEVAWRQAARTYARSDAQRGMVTFSEVDDWLDEPTFWDEPVDDNLNIPLPLRASLFVCLAALLIVATVAACFPVQRATASHTPTSGLAAEPSRSHNGPPESPSWLLPTHSAW